MVGEDVVRVVGCVGWGARLWGIGTVWVGAGKGSGGISISEYALITASS